jgi:hypothetical protein
MADQDKPDPEFNRTTNRLLRREQVRRAAEEVSTMTGPGLESMLARISAETTAEAVERLADATPAAPPPRSHPSKP